LLIDTAGIRPTDDAVELLGVGQSQAILQDIDLVLNVLDAANPSPDSMQLTHFNNSALSVYNKIDLLDDIDIMDLPCRDHVYCVSAETGRGINDLLEGILTELVPNPPQVGKPVLFMPEQVNALQKAKDLLEKGEISASLRQLEQILNGENP
jgi:tRNA U34 5-carboxymethylaminomethyl modifying GTPase MnmE/TrmE